MMNSSSMSLQQSQEGWEAQRMLETSNYTIPSFHGVCHFVFRGAEMNLHWIKPESRARQESGLQNSDSPLTSLTKTQHCQHEA